MILNNIEETGQNVRKWYQRKLPSDNTKDYYFIIRDTNPAESVLIEYGFVDSNKDDKNQIKNNWQNMAEAVVKAVADYKGYNYVEPNSNTVNDTYKVQKGDSLWSIAKRFNVGVNELKAINNLSSNLISIGQELVIPGVAPSSQTNVTYKVQKGDTLWSIANSNNTTIDEIANLNDLAQNTIYEGQILKIPNTTQTIDNNLNNNVYIVQKGDSLYSIAKKFNTTPQKIVEKNNLTSTIIVIGQSLLIPGDSESTGLDSDVSNDEKLYTVQKGDTLWSIARKYNVTVNSIRMMNNLKSDILTIGQTLIIP